MQQRKLRILYVDETAGFGGGMVGLRNLAAGLDPDWFEAGIAMRAQNKAVLSYLRRNLPAGINIWAIRRWDIPRPAFLQADAAQGLLSRKARALLSQAHWGMNFLADTVPAALRMASIAKRWHADAIHTNEQLLTNIAGVLASAFAGIPCFSHTRMYGIRARLARFFIPFVAHFFAMSDFIKNDLLGGGVPPEKISVVHDGVDLDQFQESGSGEDVRKELGIAPNRCVVSIFGRLVPWKGHAFFLNALAAASRRDPSLVGLIAGDTSPPGGPLMRQLKALAQSLEIRQRVLFLGYRTDVPRLLSASHIVVVPSIEPEPAGLVNYEAMAMARPVIATRVGGIPEWIIDGENGLLIAPNDVEGFTAAILRLSRDPDLARRMGRRGRDIVERQFTIRAYAEAVSREYERVLRGRRREGA